MKKIKEALVQENIVTGYLYFYIHFAVEVMCFFVLYRLVGNKPFLWLAPIFYDAIAFVPQGVIGYFSDKFPKVRIGLIGLFLLITGFILFGLNIVNPYIAIFLVAIGNAFLHVDGAEITLRTANGNLSHSAIFVAGGSFGVITGRLLGRSTLSFWLIVLLGISTIPFILLADSYRDDIKSEEKSCSKFNYANEKISGGLIIGLAIFIVSVRGYMGYGLPTSWNKTVIQTILLYFAMGFGKALGGILSDAYSIKKVAIYSSLISLPFLLIGDNLMIVSLVGVLFFSMTMAITLGIIVSVLKKTPGLGFGMTTLGLFLGSIPVFIFKINSLLINCMIISILTILCVFIFKWILKDGGKDEQDKMDI